MGKQHRSFKKDIDLLSEAYGAMLGGSHTFQGTGIAATQAADHMRDEDGEDKTGHLSDEDLLAKVKDEGTAGKALLDAAKARIDKGDSLTDDERDALARDAYEGNEDTDEADAGPEAERRESESDTARGFGFNEPDATPAH